MIYTGKKLLTNQGHFLPWFRYQPLNPGTYSGLHGVIAVPSRLYYPRSTKKPLNGMRISTKDNMHLAGIVTSLGSRSYAACYGAQDSTSAYIQRLIDQGALVVRKTKLIYFLLTLDLNFLLTRLSTIFRHGTHGLTAIKDLQGVQVVPLLL